MKLVGCITSIGGLEELRLPSDGPSVHIVLKDNELSQLNEQEKKAINNFFEEFDDVFAKHDKDLGLSKDVQHKIDTGTILPFKSRAIRRSKTSEAVAEAEIKKLLDAGLLVHSHSP